MTSQDFSASQVRRSPNGPVTTCQPRNNELMKTPNGGPNTARYENDICPMYCARSGKIVDFAEFGPPIRDSNSGVMIRSLDASIQLS